VGKRPGPRPSTGAGASTSSANSLLFRPSSFTADLGGSSTGTTRPSGFASRPKRGRVEGDATTPSKSCRPVSPRRLEAEQRQSRRPERRHRDRQPQKETGGTAGDRWRWSITCVLIDPDEGPRIGWTATREEAQQQLAGAWRAWLTKTEWVYGVETDSSGPTKKATFLFAPRRPVQRH